MMEWVSRFIRLAPFMMLIFFLCGCRSQQIPIVKSEKRTIRVTQREVPVFTPESSIKINGKISWNHQLEKFELSNIEASSKDKPNKKPKISVSVDSCGNLDIGVTMPSDTLIAVANDSTITDERENVVLCEKELTWWQKSLMFIGSFAVIFFLFKFVLRKHNL